MTNRIRAFTLIELLIVVAIIAILAAIAVPNFLEAQVRSKVSRVKSDMRSVGVAIEAYRIDQNRYPPDYDDARPDVGNHPQFSGYVGRLKVLTTPVAFMTTLPEDVFAEAALSRNALQATPYEEPPGSGNRVRPYTFDYAKKDTQPINGIETATLSSNSFTTWSRISPLPDTTAWAIKSVGPDLEATVLGNNAQLYDPTNGTVSRGDIYYVGPGIGFGNPLAPAP